MGSGVKYNPRVPLARAFLPILLLVLLASGCDHTSSSTEPPSSTSGGGSGDGLPDCVRGEVIDASGSCVPVGVSICPEGFVREEGGCVAIVPDAPCPEGEMALPGEAACAPVIECGTGKWGNIPQPPGTTRYVDQSYVGMDADGTIDRPYPTIDQALDGAPAGTTIAVTDGIYAEEVLPGRAQGAVQLYGRCPERVTIAGTGQMLFGSLEVTGNASGTLVSGFSVESTNGFGVTVSGVQDVVLENLWVRDTINAGVAVDSQLGPTRVTLRRILVQRVRGSGVQARAVGIDIDGIEVRDAIAGLGGGGVGLSLIGAAGEPTTATVRRAVLQGTIGAGIGMQASSLTLSASLIRDIAPIAGSQDDGMGVATLEGVSPELTLDGVVIERTHDAGVFLTNASAIVRNTTVRDVQPQVSDQRGGVALAITTTGTTPPPAVLEVEDCLLQRATGFGVFAVDAEARVSRSWIRRSAPLAENELFGDGIIVLALDRAAAATIEEVAVEENARAGLSNFGADVTLRGNRLTCNAFDLNGESTDRGDFFYEDLGGNYCGCDELAPCRAATSNLAVPSLP